MRRIEKKIFHIYEAGLDNMVVLVSTRVNESNYVMSCGTMAEVSHTPPLLSISICPERYTHDHILEKGAFSVNLLSIKQKALAMICGSSSGRSVDKFTKYNIKYILSNEGLPFIDGCLANIGCKLIASHDHGDHTIFVGEMTEARVFGERTHRHLLLSDMSTRWPRFIKDIAQRFIFIHWLRRKGKEWVR
jgi:flavin reductase (DIM6/NTAB) family NADH-FMN oxidoreductase RutF